MIIEAVAAQCSRRFAILGEVDRCQGVGHLARIIDFVRIAEVSDTSSNTTLLFTAYFSILTASPETFHRHLVIFDSPAHGGHIHRNT